MNIVYRSVKGSKLTSDEVDGNFQYLESLLGGSGNSLQVETGFTLVDQDLTINSGWIWKILGISYTNASSVNITIPLAAPGKERIDLIIANQSNTFIRVPGVESDSNPVAPSLPNNTVLVTFYQVTDGVVSTPTNPTTGTQFKQKNESQKFTSVLGGTDAVIELQTYGQQYYCVVGPVTSIKGFSKALITASPTAELPYGGKDFFFKNITSHDVTLIDNSTSVDIAFNLGTDLVVPINGIVWLKYNPNTEQMDLFFKSWSEIDISGKQDKIVVVSSNTTASNDQKYHVVANATFTDPSPVEGKGYEVFVRNGVATIGGTAYPVGSYVFRTFHSGSWSTKLIGDFKKSFQYNTTSLCIFNFPANSNWVLQSGTFGMGAYGSARSDAGTSNFLTLISSASYSKIIGGIAPYDMKLTENLSFVSADSNLIGGDLKLVVGYIELNYSTGVISNATIVETGTYTPLTGGRVDLKQDFTGGITIPKGAVWCYSWAHTKTSAVSSVYIQTILNFEQI